MWRRLPLRTRLLLPLAAIFVVALLLSTAALHIFATEQLAEESGPATRSAKAVAEALNAALKSSDNPRRTLEAFAGTLGTTGNIQFRPAGPAALSDRLPDVRTPLGTVPNWFIAWLAIPQIGASFPVFADGQRAGDIVFSPDVSAELYEKWIGFLAMVLGAAILTLATGAVAWFAVGTALGPLQDLADGLTRIRNGNYARPIPVAGPPEIRRSCEQANDLARRLHALSADNRDLLHKIVSLQDDERRYIARELHDELGPLLFGIRAGAVALRDAVPQDDTTLTAPLEDILRSVETLQQENRRILDHLRPLYIEELGLSMSIETLLQKARARTPGVSLTSRIDPRLNELDGPLTQTAYRVIQEGVTNALRHANASSINVRASLDGDELTIETSDDGVGLGQVKFGRGLTGMHERVRALSGTFQLVREAGRSVVRCRLPVTTDATPDEDASTGDRAGS